MGDVPEFSDMLASLTEEFERMKQTDPERYLAILEELREVVRRASLQQ